MTKSTGQINKYGRKSVHKAMGVRQGGEAQLAPLTEPVNLLHERSQKIQLEAVVPVALAGKRLDQTLAILFPDYSRARLQNWIKQELVSVDGQAKKSRDKVLGGEKLKITAQLPNQEQWEAQEIPLDIIYEDEALLVINKPIGLVVHPAVGNPDNTLVNALLNHAPELAQLPRAGIVHRLDKDTSGLLVIAKTLSAHTHLVKQLQARTVKREYQAIVSGALIAGGTIDAPIGRHPVQRQKMAVLDFGKPAITHYRISERFPAYTRLKIRLETGRTHQIRVHMAHIHHPIVGDLTYGGRLQLPKQASEKLQQTLREFKHQALHAQRLGLIHPVTNEYQEWHSALPADMQHLLTVLREDAAQEYNDEDYTART